MRQLADDEQAAITELLTSVPPDSWKRLRRAAWGAGAYEVVKDVFAKVPVTQVDSVAIRPGKPQGVAEIGGTPGIAAGNPL